MPFPAGLGLEVDLGEAKPQSLPSGDPRNLVRSGKIPAISVDEACPWQLPLSQTLLTQVSLHFTVSVSVDTGHRVPEVFTVGR